jgi:hypothetical protein
MASRQEFEGGGTKSDRIAILLATYNGEKYLEEQMRSIFSQTYSNFVIIVRDDASSDRTPAILARWVDENPDRVILLSDQCGNLGSRGNFSLLMEHCDYPYFAFCGQDDVWLPNKLRVLKEVFDELEGAHGASVPILVNSDVKIVNSQLSEISPSYFAYKSINTARDNRLDHLLVNNVVVGCSLAGNNALLRLAKPVPRDFPYEDWWVTLVAASCGIIHTVPESIMLYRQHQGNQVGAGSSRRGDDLLSILWDKRHLLQRPRSLPTRMSRAWRNQHSSAALLLRTVGSQMPAHNRDFLQAVCLPLLGDEVAAMPWSSRALLYARFLATHVRQIRRVFGYGYGC